MRNLEVARPHHVHPYGAGRGWRRGPVGAVLLAVGLVMTAACGSGSKASSSGGTITVFAAASLTGSFTTIARRFEAAHKGAKVTLSFGGSSSLAQQVKAGAPADVVATADEATMSTLTNDNLVTDNRVFARNKLSLLVGAGNPKRITSLADLARSDLAVVLCAAQVPCGRLAADVLRKAGVSVTPRSFEPDVKGVTSKVVLGEADAGIVYVTDARAAGPKAAGVAIPDNQNESTAYPIAAVRRSAHLFLARQFVTFVRSAAGQRELAGAGFTPA